MTANKHWLVPRRASPQFAGYSHVLRHLEDRILPRDGREIDFRQTVFVISGMGGVGKSETVLQFIERHSER